MAGTSLEIRKTARTDAAADLEGPRPARLDGGLRIPAELPLFYN
jgi:hypothetical protein